MATAQKKKPGARRHRVCSTSKLEHELHSHLHDARIQRTDNRAESRGPIREVKTRGAGPQVGRREASSHTVGQVKGLGTKLERVSFAQGDHFRGGHVELPKRRGLDIVAAQVAERARRRSRKRGRIDPAARVRAGALQGVWKNLVLAVVHPRPRRSTPRRCLQRPSPRAPTLRGRFPRTSSPRQEYWSSCSRI